MTIEVRNRQTGQTEALPDDAAYAAWQSGAVDMPAGATVPVVGPDGTVGRMAAERMQDALSAGYRTTTEQHHAEAEQEALYGGAGGKAVAATTGALSALTFGGSDLAVDLLDRRGGTREFVAGARRENPTTAAAGEVGGVALSMLLGNEAGAAEAAPGILSRLTSAPRLASRFGERAASVAERWLPAAESTIGRIGRRAAVAGVQGAAESVPYAIGHQVSEYALGDKDKTASEIAAAIGWETLAGGFAGGIFGGAGAALGEGVQASGRALSNVAKGTESLAVRAGEAAGVEGRAGGDWLLDGLAAATGKRYGSRAEAVDELATRLAQQSTGAERKHFKALATMQENNPRAYERVGQILQDELPAALGKERLGQIAAKEDMQEAAKIVRQRVSDEFERVTSVLDSPAAIEYQPDTIRIAERMRSEVIEPLRGEIGTAKTIKKLEAYVDELLDKRTGATFSDLRRERVAIDKNLVKRSETTKAALDTPLNNAYQQFRRIMEGEIESSAGRAAEALGGDVASQYMAAKADWAATRWISDALDNAVAKQGANRKIGLSEMIWGMGGLASGGPAGILTAGAGAALAHVVKHQGDAIVSGLLHSAATGSLPTLSTLARISDSTQSNVTRQIGGYVRQSVSRMPASVGSAVRAAARESVRSKPRDVPREYGKATAAVQAFRRDPAGAVANVGRSVEPIVGHAPGITAALVQHTARTAEYLASKLPKTAQRASLTPQLDSPDVPRYQKEAFLRVYAAANDPVGAVRDGLRDRTLDRATVDTVRDLYPPVFAQMQTAAMTELANAKRPVPYADRVAIGLLLGVPSDPSLEPSAIAALQKSYAAEQGDDTEDRPSRGGQPATSKSLSSEMTETQRISAG